MTCESDKWHEGLGHIGRESMKSMNKKDLVVRIPKIEVEKDILFMIAWVASKTFFPLSQHIVEFIYWSLFMGISADLLHPQHLQR